MLYVQTWTPDDGRKDRPKRVVIFNKLEKIVHLVGFTTEKSALAISKNQRQYRGLNTGLWKCKTDFIQYIKNL